MLTSLLLACSGETTDPTTTVDDGLADLPASPCQDFDYLPLEEMGAVVATQAAPELSYDAAGVDGVFALLGVSELGPAVYGVDTWRFRYVTQDRGERAEATGALIVPRDVTGDTPLVMWEHPTVGATDLCAPSGLGAYGLFLPMAWAAKYGVVVVAPDYLGMNSLGAAAEHLHPYVVGEPTAIASLDAARAALTIAADLDLAARPDPAQVAVWGASQGGHAALWVDRFASGYAPELTFKAVVAAVPPTDLEALAERGLTAWNDTSETMVGVSTASADWYGLDLEDALLPEVATAVLDEVTTTCNILDPAGELDTLESVFTPGFLAAPADDWAAYPDWACAFGANSLRGSPLPSSGAPILMLLGEQDTLAWSPPARADAEAFCEQGMSVSLLECAGKDHEDAALDTLDLQGEWLMARLAGEPVTDACDLPPAASCD